MMMQLLLERPGRLLAILDSLIEFLQDLTTRPANEQRRLLLNAWATQPDQFAKLDKGDDKGGKDFLYHWLGCLDGCLSQRISRLPTCLVVKSGSKVESDARSFYHRMSPWRRVQADKRRPRQLACARAR
jgi:hypothetical protein